jgi:CxxC-x17-CxxC domain-containing protein
LPSEEAVAILNGTAAAFASGAIGIPIAREALVEDKTLVCKDCSNNFTFSVRDQQFFAEKGFENEPQRCRDCRKARKSAEPGAMHPGGREVHETICAQCGVTTTVPFRPRGDKPVYCRTCFTAAQTVRA